MPPFPQSTTDWVVSPERRSLADGAPGGEWSSEPWHGLIRCGLDGHIREASRWVCGRFHYRLSDLCGRPLADLIDPAARPTLADYWRNLLDGELAQCAWHHRFRTSDGTSFWGQTCLGLVHGLDGRPDSVEVIVSDRADVLETDEALAESRRRLSALVSRAPVVLWAVDRHGTFTVSEGKGLVALGLRPNQAVGRSVYDMYRDQPDAIALVERALAGEEFSATVRIGELAFDCAFCPVRDAEDRVTGVMGVSTDVSARDRAEKHLRESEQRLREQNAALLDLARSKHVALGEWEPALAQITETAARVLRVGRASVWLFSPDRRQVICADLYEAAGRRHLSGDRLSAAEYPAYFAALESERTITAHDARSDERTREFVANYLLPHDISAMLDSPIRSSGQVIGVVCQEQVGQPRAWTAEDELFAGSLADLVSLALEARERRRAEEALRTAKSELEERVQERTQELSSANDELRREVADRVRAVNDLRSERRHMARILVAHERDRQLTAYEIHDGLVQDITAAQLHLESLANRVQDGLASADRESLKLVLELVRKGIAEGRQLISGLRPTVIDEMGLVAAIDYLASECHLASGEPVEFAEAVNFERLEPLLEGTLYRIAQEALTNVERYSGAHRARVELTQAGDCVRLEIRDWGQGFDPDQVDRHHFGLEGIRERARLLGGQATIESRPGEGTRVSVELPLTPEFFHPQQEPTA